MANGRIDVRFAASLAATQSTDAQVSQVVHPDDVDCEFDGPPVELGALLSEAAPLNRPQSARRTPDAAFAKPRETRLTFRELNRMQRRLIAKGARKIWAPDRSFVAVEPSR